MCKKNWASFDKEPGKLLNTTILFHLSILQERYNFSLKGMKSLGYFGSLEQLLFWFQSLTS